MLVNILTLLALLGPIAFTTIGIVSKYQINKNLEALKKATIITGLFNIIIFAIIGVFVINQGLIESTSLSYKGFGLSLRLDPLSTIMSAMIALIGFIVIKYSLNYLNGDKRQGIFLGRLAMTLASVQLFVISGNLGLLFVGWYLTSVSLNRLLLFYSERAGAIIAAKKKFIMARLGDVSLLIAVILLYNKFGSGNLEIIFEQIRFEMSSLAGVEGMAAPAAFIVIAAILKSAQFPTHGWLVEVMETPTPVSALLHAGLLNAGPFLVVRMAFVMEAAPSVSMILIIVGSFTAIFASIVYLTQTSVKTALGYSSIGHMGFSLLICGLGLYPAAMLHLVAHSFYKAHAFLASGSVIDTLRNSRVVLPARIGSPLRIITGIFLACGVYFSIAYAFGVNFKEDLSLLFVGAIVLLGLFRILATTLDSSPSIRTLSEAIFLSALVVTSFFALESGSDSLLSSEIPVIRDLGLAELIVLAAILLVFFIAVIIQLIAPALKKKPAFNAVAIHLRNGLYVNTWFDKLVGALKV